MERTEWLTPAGRLAEGSKEEADFLLRGSCLFPFLRLNRRPLKGGREKLRGGRKRGWKGGREGRKGRRKERRPVVAMETHARDFLGVVPWAGALNESPNNRLSLVTVATGKGGGGGKGRGGGGEGGGGGGREEEEEEEEEREEEEEGKRKEEEEEEEEGKVRRGGKMVIKGRDDSEGVGERGS